MPVSGNDYWMPELPITERRASALSWPNGGSGFNFSYPCGGIAAQGVPNKGEDKGCIYVASGKGWVNRVFRSKTKESRWWFAPAMEFGSPAVPRKRGVSVAANEPNLGWVSRLQIRYPKRQTP